MTTLVKKQLALGCAKSLSKTALTVHVACTELHSAFSRYTYSCTYNNKSFVIEECRARNGIDTIDMLIDPALFKTKAELTRFYREVKSIAIVDA